MILAAGRVLVAVLAAITQLIVGLIASFLPARYWNSLNAHGIPTFPVLSPLVTVCAAVMIGLPVWFRYVVVSAHHAQRLAAVGASQLPRPPEQEVILAAAQTISLVTAVSFLFTPAGFTLSYLVGSGALRLLATYSGDPSGDPMMSSMDWVTRRFARFLSGLSSRISLRATFGCNQTDEVVPASRLGFTHADVIVIASRPKREWTAGTIIFREQCYYVVLDPVEKIIGRRRRVVYPLKRQHGFDIVRRALRYPE
jgi:hypothetical protein